MSAELLLVMGNRNYSSWSLRPWMLLRHLELPFRELVLSLDTPEFQREVGRYSPSRRVPVLIDGDLKIWETIAICEYLVEKKNGRGWPQDPAARANARAVAAEMHAGFAALRSARPMNVRERGRHVPLTPAVSADIARIDSLWSDCRRQHGKGGPWLFGADYTAADAMFAPVVTRFNTYGAQGLGTTALEYVDTVLADPHLQNWMQLAAVEPEKLPSTDSVGM
jgi:glutathione S-transferase